MVLFLMHAYAGTQDYKKPLANRRWAYCYLNHCCRSPDLYPVEFNTAARMIILQDFNMDKSDINVNNAKIIYLHLLHIFTTT